MSHRSRDPSLPRFFIVIQNQCINENLIWGPKSICPDRSPVLHGFRNMCNILLVYFVINQISIRIQRIEFEWRCTNISWWSSPWYRSLPNSLGVYHAEKSSYLIAKLPRRIYSWCKTMMVYGYQLSCYSVRTLLAMSRPPSPTSCPEDHGLLVTIVAKHWALTIRSWSVQYYRNVVTNTTQVTHWKLSSKQFLTLA